MNNTYPTKRQVNLIYTSPCAMLYSHSILLKHLFVVNGTCCSFF
jgi:hypothetical protein